MRSLSILALVGFLGLSSFNSRPALADDVYEIVIKKQEQKKLSRWSLSDWLETKNRMRLMDMWLALHTPSPFEFYLGGNYQFATRDGDAYTGGGFELAAFAAIFGLEFQREQSSAKIMNGLFHLRLFGFHNQTTNITLHGGLRFRGSGDALRSPVAGVTTNLYLMKYFGLEGMYRHIFNSTTSSLGYRIHAKRYEAGAFIDFKFLRLFGTYFHEQEMANAPQFQQYFPLRKGAMLGAKLFF